MSAISNYLENKIIDWLMRGQAYTPPTTLYVALYASSGAPSDSGGGTEVTGGGYARVAITSSLTAWAGTQAAGSLTASSGTSGTTSNNNPISFPAPTGDWGVIGYIGILDASSAGNLLWWGALSQVKTVNNGDAAPSFAAAALAVQLDN